MTAVAEGGQALAEISSALCEMQDLEQEDDRSPAMSSVGSDEVFNQLENPTEEAKSDADKFLAKYFLDEDGEPAPGNYQEAFVLWVDDRETRLTTKVKAIPGLKAYCPDRLRVTVVGWAGRAFERGLDEAFCQVSEVLPLDTPDAEALFDVDRFLAKYFMDRLRGQPDKQKTPEPIQLQGWVYVESPALRDRVRSMYPDGLRRAKAKTNKGSFVVIGWGSETVKSRVRKVEDEAARRIMRKVSRWEAREKQRRAEESERVEEVQERERFLRGHKEYAKGHRAPTGTSILEDLVGSYVVECPEISNKWPDHNSPMTLDVHAATSSSGTQAAFALGIIEGTMLLGTSEEAIRQLEQEAEEAEKDTEDGLDEDEVIHDDPTAGMARKRKAHGQPDSSRPLTRRRLDHTPRPNRVFLRWRGRNSNTGEIQGPHLQEHHVGYLDVSAGGLTAKGKMAHPGLLHEKLHIKIYKVASESKDQPEPWSELSDRKWQAMCSTRW